MNVSPFIPLSTIMKRSSPRELISGARLETQSLAGPGDDRRLPAPGPGVSGVVVRADSGLVAQEKLRPLAFGQCAALRKLPRQPAVDLICSLRIALNLDEPADAAAGQYRVGLGAFRRLSCLPMPVNHTRVTFCRKKELFGDLWLLLNRQR